MASKQKKLLIRADASVTIGIGHVMRCLALAQKWIDLGGSVLLLTRKLPPVLRKRIEKERNLAIIEVEDSIVSNMQKDAEFLLKISSSHNIKIIVLDGYHFDSSYQRKVKESDNFLVSFDDYGQCLHYYADIVLNRSVISQSVNYSSKEPYTKLLLGPQYSILRREFMIVKDRVKETVKNAKKVLITIGGADFNNVSKYILRTLDCLEEYKLHIKILIGSANIHVEELKKEAEKIRHKVEILMETETVAQEMIWSDFVITAGGNTIYELAYLGIPSISIRTASNQKGLPVFDYKYKTTIFLGDWNKIDKSNMISQLENIIDNKELRQAMHENGLKLMGNLEQDFIKEIMDQINEECSE